MRHNQYPALEIDLGQLKENLAALKQCCQDSSVGMTLVIKGITADREVAKLYDEAGASYIASSRIDQIRKLHAYGLKTPLMLIRVPMLSELEEAVSLCEASLQSDLTVIRATSEEAKRQNKVHKVLLMIDLGDLREGFWDPEELVACAEEIEKEHPHLELIGVGVNLSCYGSVKPNLRNMQGLVSLAADVEKAIGRELQFISGGASTSFYMVQNGSMPTRVNNLRIGELILTGQINGYEPGFTHLSACKLHAEVIECREKPSFPVGELEVDAFGEVGHYEDKGIRKRALVAVGRVDYGDPFNLTPCMEGVEVIGASSDHTILDVTDAKEEIRVGDVLVFRVKYSNLVYLSNTESVQIRYSE